MATPGKNRNFGQQWIPEVQQSVENSYQSRPSGMPSLAVIKQETKKLGLPDSDAEHIYDVWLMDGFKTKHGPIRSYKAAIRNWYRKKWFHSQRSATAPGFQAPSEEEFLRYCDSKKMTRTYGLKLYRFLVARGWKYFGTPVTTEDQWKAICHTHEFNDR
jgi:hypothetical protein